jgi:hypothetical protein
MAPSSARIKALAQRIFPQFAELSVPSQLALLLGLVVLLAYVLDGTRWPLFLLSSALLLLALGPPAMRSVKMSLTGLSMEFQQRAASQIVVLARRPQGAVENAETIRVTDASIRAAARAIAEAPTPEAFIERVSDFLELRWKPTPSITEVRDGEPGRAAQDYAARYLGESAFLKIARGQAGQFAVGYTNIGRKAWITGTESQADLVRPPTKPDNSAFAAGWLSQTRYATQYALRVEPGEIGYFAYNVLVPGDAAAGIYRFWFRPETRATILVDDGGYQDVEVVA